MRACGRKICGKMLILVLLCPLLLYLAVPLLPTMERDAYAADKAVDDELRGIWVSTVINLDYPAKPTADADQLMAEADAILDDAAALGMNAVFLQVRPCADAFYESDIYPWSVYLTGEQGQAPTDGFDPLAYWVKAAHKRGLELHAWINPYRITRAAAEWDKLAADHPAKLNPDWVIEYKGNYYFDPALADVRELVISGAVEIVKNYDVDGIHMDDYFYPGTDFDDSASFAAYGGDMDLADWRRDNVNKLVKGLYKAIKAADKNVDFGISPAGIWASKTLNELGSDTTSTYSSYYGSYADTRAWVKDGWLDYIAPQIYWERGHKTADFTALLDWWSEQVKGTGVALYIGLADYKTLEAKTSDSAWYDGREIAGQLADCAANSEVDGVIHFRYGSVKASAALQRVIKAAVSAGAADAVTGNVAGNAATVPAAGNTGAQVSVVVDGKQLEFDTAPYVENGRVLLPMRVIFEELGATVDYAAGKIVAQRGGVIIRLELGSDVMTVGADALVLDVPAKAVGGRTLLPLRAVAEALDAQVDWDGAAKRVTITRG